MPQSGDADDIHSMVGCDPRLQAAIDEYTWGRKTLRFTGVTSEEHETLARHLGSGAAAEVLLLIVAQKCKGSTDKWQEAAKLGIPWRRKTWTDLTRLQQDYHKAVCTFRTIEEQNPHPGLSDAHVPMTPHGFSSASASAPPRYFALEDCPGFFMSAPPTQTLQDFIGSQDVGETPLDCGRRESSSPPAAVPPPPAWPPLEYAAAADRSKSWPQTAKVQRARSANTATRCQHHFDKTTFDQHQLEIKRCSILAKCKFSGHPKYDLEVKEPNHLNIKWLYSVPCGGLTREENCTAWIFIAYPADLYWDSQQRKHWVHEYLNDLGWMVVSNQDNKRFICPNCTNLGQ